MHSARNIIHHIVHLLFEPPDRAALALHVLKESAQRAELGTTSIVRCRAAIDLLRVRWTLQVCVEAPKLRESPVANNTFEGRPVPRQARSPHHLWLRFTSEPVGPCDEASRVGDDVRAVVLDSDVVQPFASDAGWARSRLEVQHKVAV